MRKIWKIIFLLITKWFFFAKNYEITIVVFGIMRKMLVNNSKIKNSTLQNVKSNIVSPKIHTL